MKKLTYLLPLLLGLLAGCDGDGDEQTPEGFARDEMLSFVADDLILPRFVRAADAVFVWQQAVNELTADLTATRLTEARAAWNNAYAAYLECASFNFGPGDGTFGPLVTRVATFPVDVAQLEGYIAAGDTTLNNFNFDTQGFLAAEYLLYADQPLARLTDDVTRRAYLRQVAASTANQVRATADGWVSYRDEFIRQDGTDASSSTALLFNDFSQDYERLKNFRIGLPLGKRAGQTAPQPELVEARYSGRSLPLARTHFEGLVRLWAGQAEEQTGPSFRDYLLTVEGGEALVADTEAQIEVIRQAFGALPDQPLADLIATMPETVDPLHTALSQHTRYFKSDMSSLLGISISFNSNDGD